MTPTVLLIGGGTGGHTFPLLAIGDALRERAPGTRLVAVCSTRQVDIDIVGAAHETGRIDEIIPIPAVTFTPRNLFAMIRSWGACVRAVSDRIECAEGPVVAVSSGGFVSVPGARACTRRDVPMALVAMDVPPGKATSWIARRAKLCVNAAPVDLPGWQRVGPIVRTEARPTGTPREARESTGLEPDRRTLLVMGGSQGAKSVNRFLSAFLARHGPLLAQHGWQVLHQSGTRDLETASADAERVRTETGLPIVVRAFFDPVGLAWSAADLVLGRGGAGTIAEISAARVPALIMPYPYHRDRHQVRNAEHLVRAGTAVVVTDHDDAERNMRDAGVALHDLMLDADRLDRMIGAFGEARPADGALDVADRVLPWLGTNRCDDRPTIRARTRAGDDTP
jgi:UDP-N-acetylglucosamine--N-acetylmuramyl-(pentapeptide) pyrophosphoryl-undecaprenol N-acetylglucosamine transferase